MGLFVGLYGFFAVFLSICGYNAYNKTVDEYPIARIAPTWPIAHHKLHPLFKAPPPPPPGYDNTVDEYPIAPIAPTDIKDTNGCGDAFVGGFLARLLCQHPVVDCIHRGHYAAHAVLQHWGCNYPSRGGDGGDKRE